MTTWRSIPPQESLQFDHSFARVPVTLQLWRWKSRSSRTVRTLSP